MKIVQFTAENVKKLKVVDITPTKDFIQITGKNGSGKTSVLDSIWWALAGKEAIQGKPIRKGEEKAKIKLNLGDLIVERRFTENGTSLTVTNSDGFKASSPQALLDAIIGNLTFDPLEFSRLDARKQFDQLRHIAQLKIDIDALAKEDNEDAMNRRDLNRDIKSLEAQIAAINVPEDTPDNPIDVASVMAEIEQIRNYNAGVIVAENRKQSYEEQLGRIRSDIRTIESDIERLQKQLQDAKERESKGIKAIEELVVPTAKDDGHLRIQVEQASKINATVEQKRQKAKMEKDLASKQAGADVYSDRIQARATRKAEAFKEAKMPISGLSFGDGEILFNEIPFDQLSAGEQLRISVSIAMAANPKLRIIRVKDGSLLDDEGLKTIQTAAAENDYQVWVEKTDSSGKIGIYLEEGEIKAINEGEE